VPYWTEDRAYVFEASEIDKIQKVTSSLYDMCLQAVQQVIKTDRWSELGIPKEFIPLVKKSWEHRDHAVYGRFDFSYTHDGQLKLLEFNADTPTMLMESSVVQHYWLERHQADLVKALGGEDREIDQFNQIQDHMIDAWDLYRRRYLQKDQQRLHFSCMKGYPEDVKNVAFIYDCAKQAGLDVDMVYVEDIGWNGLQFTDLDEKPIENLFKLYPWEMLWYDEFSRHLLEASMEHAVNQRIRVIEPAWKMILSNKAILPILWDIFPDHPNLLPSYFEQEKIPVPYVKKPLLSREGANVTIVKENETVASDGIYTQSGYIYQAYSPLPKFEHGYPMIGSWVIGGKPAGIGIRESNGLITDNFSRFVPHIVV